MCIRDRPSTPGCDDLGAAVDAPLAAGALVFGLGVESPRAGSDRSGRPGQRPRSSAPRWGG
eukprot:9694697-Alexandrium_andersonii.AAC.1